MKQLFILGICILGLAMAQDDAESGYDSDPYGNDYSNRGSSSDSSSSSSSSYPETNSGYEKTYAEQVDPCADVKCNMGEMCREGNCVCADECHPEWNNYPRGLCVNDKTFRHECDLYRNLCYCKKGDSRCGLGRGLDVQEPLAIQYHADCVDDMQGLCPWEKEKETFHLRLSLWFRDLLSSKWSAVASSQGDDSLLSPMSAKTRSKVTKLFEKTGDANGVNPGILTFWFCTIDANNDGNLSPPEIGRLTQLLLPSTPCALVFLESCKTGGLAGWHQCFNLPEGYNAECRNFN